MQYVTIKNLIITGAGIICLIWGVIFFLIFSDPSYHLIALQLPNFRNIAATDSATSDIKTIQSVPLKQELVLATGEGTTFKDHSVLVKGAATPSAALRNNELLAYFNYFPAGDKRTFGSIHQIKSTDQGQTWSKPTQIMIFNAPQLDTMPFSPKVIILPNNKIKLFFLAQKKDENQTKLFAALSDDGIKFAFDPSTSFDLEGQSLTSFALTILNHKMHLLAYTKEGAEAFTAHHAISYDTSVFTRLADVVIKDSYYGQNTLIADGSKLLLYGASGKGLWRSTSTDGNSWSSINYLSYKAENPGIVTVGDTYYLLYTKTSE